MRAAPRPTAAVTATPAARRLLAAGAAGGPLYVVVSTIEIAVRPGFDPSRHPWSLLANGPGGWVHVGVLLVLGTSALAAAGGLRRTLGGGRGSVWAPRLLGAYGASVLVAAVLRADPAQGFPPGTPSDAAAMTWQGAVHYGVAGLGFVCLAAACEVMARRFTSEHRPAWATFSRLAGLVLVGSWLAMVGTAGSAAGLGAFTGGVVLVSAWVTAVTLDRIRRTR